LAYKLEINMKKLCVALSAAGLLGLAACATTEAPAEKKSVVSNATTSAPKSVELGSRIPRTTTDRLVKKTERDLADEPVRSISNTVGIKGQ
jgi:hypothetical protein